MMPLDHLEENYDEEAAERGIPVKRSIEHAFVGLAVVAIVTGGAGQCEALGDGKMYWTDMGDHTIQRVNLNGTGLEDLVTTGLTRRRDKIILFARDCRWKGHRSWACALLVGGAHVRS
jgi:hypothetical protein